MRDLAAELAAMYDVPLEDVVGAGTYANADTELTEIRRELGLDDDQ